MNREWMRACRSPAFAIAALVSASCAQAEPLRVVANEPPAVDASVVEPRNNDAAAGITIVSSSDAAGVLAITPSNQVVVVDHSDPVPRVQFQARVGGSPASGVTFAIDRPEIGHIDANGLFVPTGLLAGVATISATSAEGAGATSVTVRLNWTQNGAGAADLMPDAGAGGLGGVGGEGLGGSIDDGHKAVLLGTTTTDSKFRWLYPYDQTVWPRGVLAPLLQWSASTDPDALLLQIDSANFHYQGFFGRPSGLASGASLQRHPIPESVWTAATDSASDADKIVVRLILSASGRAYASPVQTWIVAPARLEGTLYYNSYGTRLSPAAGAVLAITRASTDPVVVSGHECTVCHTVSADGSRMLAQHGDDYDVASMFDLKSATGPITLDQKNLAWGALYPDGSLILTNGGLRDPTTLSAPTALYELPSQRKASAQGLDSFVSRAAMPSFSPDGKHVAFNFYEGPGAPPDIPPGDGRQLVAMDADRTNLLFGNPRAVVTESLGHIATAPTFLPTSDALVYERAVAEIVGDPQSPFRAWTGTTDLALPQSHALHSELWWVDLATHTPHRLDQLNGRAPSGQPYLPSGPNGHDDDTLFNYQPTANPIASGGYAWVVFTSRRLYGNVATVDPSWSDSRQHDLGDTPNTKKLWVAAIDLHPAPGSDPSYPAFYLPAQELVAGNSRGFWVPEPCRADGISCDRGDQCCGGYCREYSHGPLMCGAAVPRCSNEGERCDAPTDCCHSNSDCINEFCVLQAPPIH